MRRTTLRFFCRHDLIDVGAGSREIRDSKRVAKRVGGSGTGGEASVRRVRLDGGRREPPRRARGAGKSAGARDRELGKKHGSGGGCPSRGRRRPPSGGKGRARTHGLSLSSSRSASSAAMVLARREASRGVPPSAPPRAGNRRRKPKTNLTPTLARRGCASQVFQEPGLRATRLRACPLRDGVHTPRRRHGEQKGARPRASSSSRSRSDPPPALRATAPFARVATQFFPRARGLDRAPRAPRASRV